MKIFFTLLLSLPLFLLACDNELASENVPEAVKQGLDAHFPEVRVLEWEKIGRDYVAEFNLKNIPYEVMISPEGHMLMYKYDIREEELPPAVQATIRQKYPDLPIANTEVLHYEGSEYYQVAFDDDLRDYWQVFSKEGAEVDKPAYMK